MDQLFQQWNSPTSPGCAVAVMKGGHIVYERGFGMADLEHQAKITPATVFNVGSRAKQFTGALILMLAQEGKISLDDQIRKYTPELPTSTADELRELAGEYSSNELDVPYFLTVDGNGLVLHVPKSAPLPVAPVARDLFIGGDRRLRFTHDSKGSVSGLLMSGYWNRVQNLRFIRTQPP